jgi:hypothetical protein
MKCVIWSIKVWVFVFWAHWCDWDHPLNHLWLKFFMRILGRYLVFLCLQIFNRLLKCSHYVMLNALLYIMFPSPNILQHYLAFNIYTIVMLESYLVWVFYWSFNLSSSHFTCFFGKIRPPFYSLDCYPPILIGMLGINYSYTSQSFLARWSPIPFGCNNTCWN